MIVVDSNVVAYSWINGPLTKIAQSVRAKDPDWHVPVLWRSEMRSILTGYLPSISIKNFALNAICMASPSKLQFRFSFASFAKSKSCAESAKTSGVTDKTT